MPCKTINNYEITSNNLALDFYTITQTLNKLISYLKKREENNERK